MGYHMGDHDHVLVSLDIYGFRQSRQTDDRPSAYHTDLLFLKERLLSASHGYFSGLGPRQSVADA